MVQAQARASLEVPQPEPPEVQRARATLRAKFGVNHPQNRDQRRLFARALTYERMKELVK